MGWHIGKLAVMLTALAACGEAAKLPAQGYYRPQPYGSVAQPIVSPYINLLRGGNPPVLNYLGLVRPQVDFYRSIQNLQSQVLANQQSISSFTTGQGPLLTGHPAYFLNTSHYFQSYGGVAAAATGGAPAAQQATITTPAVPPPRGRYR